jgi:hypothetical protein
MFVFVLTLTMDIAVGFGVHNFCLLRPLNFIFAGTLFEDGTINNEPSIKRLAEVSLAYAKAGWSLFYLF